VAVNWAKGLKKIPGSEVFGKSAQRDAIKCFAKTQGAFMKFLFLFMSLLVSGQAFASENYIGTTKAKKQCMVTINLANDNISFWTVGGPSFGFVVDGADFANRRSAGESKIKVNGMDSGVKASLTLEMNARREPVSAVYKQSGFLIGRRTVECKNLVLDK